jgi:hypothetical protein
MPRLRQSKPRRRGQQRRTTRWPSYAECRVEWERTRELEKAPWRRVLKSETEHETQERERAEVEAERRRSKLQHTVLTVSANLKVLHAWTRDDQFAAAFDALERYRYTVADAQTQKRLHAALTYIPHMRRLVTRHRLTVRRAAAVVAMMWVIPGQSFEAVTDWLRHGYLTPSKVGRH